MRGSVFKKLKTSKTIIMMILLFCSLVIIVFTSAQS